MIIYITHPCISPAFETDRSPNARSHKTRTPVPTIMVTCLAGEYAHSLVEQSPVLRLVIDSLVGVWQCLQLLKPYPCRRVEMHHELIVLLLEQVFHSHSPSAEHVVRLQDKAVIEVDIGIGVETFEHKVYVAGCPYVFSHIETCPVDPVLLVHPLDTSFVQAHIRVINQAVRHKIGMDRAGHLCRIPVVVSLLAELPFPVKGLSAHIRSGELGHGD